MTRFNANDWIKYALLDNLRGATQVKLPNLGPDDWTALRNAVMVPGIKAIFHVGVLSLERVPVGREEVVVYSEKTNATWHRLKEAQERLFKLRESKSKKRALLEEKRLLNEEIEALEKGLDKCSVMGCSQGRIKYSEKDTRDCLNCGGTGWRKPL